MRSANAPRTSERKIQLLAGPQPSLSLEAQSLDMPVNLAMHKHTIVCGASLLGDTLG